MLEVEHDTENNIGRIAIATERKLLFNRQEARTFRRMMKALERGKEFNQEEENLARHLDLLGAPKVYFELVQKANPEVIDEIYMLLEDIRTIKKYLAKQ